MNKFRHFSTNLPQPRPASAGSGGSSKFRLVLGGLGLFGVGGTGLVYFLDRPTFDSYFNILRDNFNGIFYPQSKPIRSPPSHHQQSNESTMKKKEIVVVTPSTPVVPLGNPVDHEKVKKNLEIEIEKLKEELKIAKMESENTKKQLQLSSLKMVDKVASAFAAELESSRLYISRLENDHERALRSLKLEFDRMVEEKVEQETMFRLSQLQGLSARIETLRAHTLHFGQFSSLHSHSLRLLKLVNILPFTRHLGTVDTVELEKDVFVKTILEEMPRDIEPTESLYASFSILKPKLKQISLVEKESGGFVPLLISRLLSFFMFDSNTRLEKIETKFKTEDLFGALEEMVELENEGWNSVVLGDLVDRLRKRVEFEVGVRALEAHLGLVSTMSILPQLVHSSSM